MQTTYNLAQAKAVVGQLVDAYDVRTNMILSGVAYGEAIPFGRGMVMNDGSNYIDGYKFRLPTTDDVDQGGEGQDDEIQVMLSVRDLQKVTGQYEDKDTVAGMVIGKMWVETEQEVLQADCEDGEVWCRVDGVVETKTLTLDGDLVAANKISATVNGTLCETTYDGVSHATTMATWAALVAACPGIASATLDIGTSRILTIVGDTKGGHITITGAAVTLGATQANIVEATVTLGVGLDGRGRFRKEDDTLNAGTFAKVDGMMWLAPHAAGMAPVMGMGFGGGDNNEQQPVT